MARVFAYKKTAGGLSLTRGRETACGLLSADVRSGGPRFPPRDPPPAVLRNGRCHCHGPETHDMHILSEIAALVNSLHHSSLLFRMSRQNGGLRTVLFCAPGHGFLYAFPVFKQGAYLGSPRYFNVNTAGTPRALSAQAQALLTDSTAKLPSALRKAFSSAPGTMPEL